MNANHYAVITWDLPHSGTVMFTDRSFHIAAGLAFFARCDGHHDVTIDQASNHTSSGDRVRRDHLAKPEANQ
jgi:hypothetical protein